MPGHPEAAAALLAVVAQIETDPRVTLLRDRDKTRLLEMLSELGQVVGEHGLLVASRCLELVPFGYAHGASHDVLSDLAGKFASKRINCGYFVCDPREEHAIEVVDTGSIVPDPTGPYRIGVKVRQ